MSKYKDVLGSIGGEKPIVNLPSSGIKNPNSLRLIHSEPPPQHARRPAPEEEGNLSCSPETGSAYFQYKGASAGARVVDDKGHFVVYDKEREVDVSASSAHPNTQPHGDELLSVGHALLTACDIPHAAPAQRQVGMLSPSKPGF